LVASGTNLNPYAEDGRKVWGKWDTLMFVEEDGQITWGGICSEVSPDDKGLQLEFIGGVGWLQRVDYNQRYSVWKTNVFDVVRHLVGYAMTKTPSIRFAMPTTMSAFSVGDKQPDEPEPQEPPRPLGVDENTWQNSDEYTRYSQMHDDWDRQYGDRKTFDIFWYEAPYVGEEIDTLAKEVGFEYRERVEWRDRGALAYQFYFDFADDMARRRDDVEFVDGMNIAKALDPKNGATNFANRVIALGSGEGRDMARASVAVNDGRLYQAEFVQYKSIAKEDRLRALAQVDLVGLNNTDPKIDSVTVWDVPGYSPVKSLLVGDEVMVRSDKVSPPIATWVKILKITRDPRSNIAVLIVETVA
jgi:hypothetical protein